MRYLALWVVSIAKNHCLTWACLDAGGLYFTVSNATPTVVFGIVLGLPNTLNAERAFLHYAVAASCNVRVELQVKWGFEFRLKPIKPSNLVGTVVRTVASADAAIVDLRVQSLVRVIRGEYRADRFAWSVIAVLAQHR